MTATPALDAIVPVPGPAPHEELNGLVTGRVLHPTDDGYDVLVTPWNVAVAARPVVVVEALDAADVAATVRYAARHGLQVSVQSTGHGAVAMNTPFVMVQTSRLDELTIDPHRQSARIGAGVRWEAVLNAAAEHGLAGLAGSAPNVGVVGYLTGGGLGPVARTYGVASDYITAFDVVTGDGQIRRATATENPALFWGLRGGKGALGIVTAVETDLLPLAQIFGGCAFFAGEHIADVLHAYRTWAPALPEQATTSVAVVRLPPMPGVPEPLAGKVTVAVRFAWVGDQVEGEQALAPMLEVAPVVLGGFGVMPYAAIGAIHADPVDPMPTTETGALLTNIDADTVDALASLVGPQADCPQVIVELRQLGGAVARHPEVSSAFDQRDAAYALLLIGIAAPPVIAAAQSHAAAVLETLAPWSTGGCLPNYEATTDPARVARKYRPETLRRLVELSAAYDPATVLAAAGPVRQAIPR